MDERINLHRLSRKQAVCMDKCRQHKSPLYKPSMLRKKIFLSQAKNCFFVGILSEKVLIFVKGLIKGIRSSPDRIVQESVGS